MVELDGMVVEALIQELACRCCMCPSPPGWRGLWAEGLSRVRRIKTNVRPRGIFSVLYHFSRLRKNQTGQCNEKVEFFAKILLPFGQKGAILLEETGETPRNLFLWKTQQIQQKLVSCDFFANSMLKK